MKLCVFQGTFNPIHNAHIRVAEYVRELYDFDKIIFIPAYIPPHKIIVDTDFSHRYEMVKLAIKNQPEFEVSNIEYERKGVSYTYHTICKLYDIYKPEGKINFIIGTDAFEKIENWYEADKLKELLNFIVFIREHNFNTNKFEYLKNKGYNFEFQPLSYKDISSTELRDKIKNGEDIGNIVTEEVKEYIITNGLYKI